MNLGRRKINLVFIFLGCLAEDYRGRPHAYIKQQTAPQAKSLQMVVLITYPLRLLVSTNLEKIE